MIICQSYDEIPSLATPIGLSIGTFDGVHPGHQVLFHFLRQKVSETGSVAALTFTNHPSQFFNHSAPTPLLCSLKHKLSLLQQLGVDLVVLTEFNADFAEQPFQEFLKKLKHSLPFSYLALGEDASFGKNREGNPESVKKIAPELNFEINYLPKILLEDQPISSGRIRSALEQGNLSEASKLLGRPYSLLLTAVSASDPLILDATHLCLPPDGVYPVRVQGTEPPFEGLATISNQSKTISLPCADLALTEGSLIEIIF